MDRIPASKQAVSISALLDLSQSIKNNLQDGLQIIFNLFPLTPIEKINENSQLSFTHMSVGRHDVADTVDGEGYRYHYHDSIAIMITCQYISGKLYLRQNISQQNFFKF